MSDTYALILRNVREAKQVEDSRASAFRQDGDAALRSFFELVEIRGEAIDLKLWSRILERAEGGRVQLRDRRGAGQGRKLGGLNGYEYAVTDDGCSTVRLEDAYILMSAVDSPFCFPDEALAAQAGRPRVPGHVRVVRTNGSRDPVEGFDGQPIAAAADGTYLVPDELGYRLLNQRSLLGRAPFQLAECEL